MMFNKSKIKNLIRKETEKQFTKEAVNDRFDYMINVWLSKRAEEAEQKIYNEFDREGFLDSVVDRINRKQIGG